VALFPQAFEETARAAIRQHGREPDLIRNEERERTAAIIAPVLLAAQTGSLTSWL